MAAKSIESVAGEIWDRFNKELEIAGLSAEDGVTLLKHAPRHLARVAEGMLGFWNAMAKGGWATIGPRMLGPRYENGTLHEVGHRTYLTAMPTASAVTILVEKRDGRAGAKIVARVHGP